MALQGRLRSVTNGCFLEAQLQGPLLGGEPGKAAVMSRPIAAGGGFLTERPVYLETGHRRGDFLTDRKTGDGRPPVATNGG